MRLLVFSDSHGWLENARNVLRRIGERMDMVCHLGIPMRRNCKRNFRHCRSMLCREIMIFIPLRRRKKWFGQAERQYC